MPTGDTLTENLTFGRGLLKRFAWIRQVRPAIVPTFLLRVLAPEDRRRIIQSRNGIQMYADPFSNLGSSVLLDEALEAETEEIFKKNLNKGDVFLDIGANEGYFSALAGKLIGDSGFVISIEPQSRLRDLIEINLTMNGISRFRIYNNAIGGDEGETGTINMWPSFNSGASSIVRKYRFSSSVETFRFVSPERIFRECACEHIDFVKIDVEGFEVEVVQHLLPHLRAGKINKMLLDYHKQILAQRNADPLDIHKKIISCGYRLATGDTRDFSSYFLYEREKT